MVEMIIVGFVYFKKSKDADLIKCDIFNSLFLGFWTHPVKKKRVINNAEKSDETIPMIKVSAKPRIGPASKLRSINAAMMVVTLESMMAENALR